MKAGVSLALNTTSSIQSVLSRRNYLKTNVFMSFLNQNRCGARSIVLVYKEKQPCVGRSKPYNQIVVLLILPCHFAEMVSDAHHLPDPKDEWPMCSHHHSMLQPNHTALELAGAQNLFKKELLDCNHFEWWVSQQQGVPHRARCPSAHYSLMEIDEGEPWHAFTSVGSGLGLTQWKTISVTLF